MVRLGNGKIGQVLLGQDRKGYAYAKVIMVRLGNGKIGQALLGQDRKGYAYAILCDIMFDQIS